MKWSSSVRLVRLLTVVAMLVSLLPSLSFATDTAPVAQDVYLDLSGKKIEITFDVSIGNVPDTSKISIQSAGKNVIPTATEVIYGKVLRVSVATALVTGAKLTLAEGAVKSLVDEVPNAVMSQRTLTKTAFPKVKSAVISSDNKTLTVSFNLASLPTATISGASHVIPYKTKTGIATDGITFFAMDTEDTVTVTDNKIVVSLETALTNQKSAIRFEAGAFRMLTAPEAGNYNLSPEIKFAINLAPTLSSVKLNATNKIVSLKFSEPILANATDLKPLVQLAANGTTFDTSPAFVAIKNDTLIATFTNELASYLNKVQISADAVKDSKGIKNALQTSDSFYADEIYPGIRTIQLGANKKTLTVFFNEYIYNKTIAAEWVNKLKVSNDGGATYTAISSPVVKISKNRMTITTTTTLAHNKQFQVWGVSVADAAGNAMTADEYVEGTIDGQGPKVYSFNTDGSGKNVTVIFDENFSKLKSLKPLISIVQGGVTLPLSNKAMSGSTATNTGSILYISNLPTGLTVGDKIIISPNLFQDGATNKNLKITITIGSPI